MTLRRLSAALLIGAAALALSACGNKENPSDIHFGPTEGVYVTAGNLKYQIQISRQLNEYYRRGSPVPDGRAAVAAHAAQRPDVVRGLHPRREPHGP